MCGLRSLNSGEERYFANSESQSVALVGGKEPVTGFHSVMLRLHQISILAEDLEELTVP